MKIVILLTALIMGFVIWLLDGAGRILMLQDQRDTDEANDMMLQDKNDTPTKNE